MKKLLLLLLLLLPLHTSYSQRLNSTNAVVVSATDPTGNACSANSPNLTYGTGNTRNLYTCQGGVYAVSTGSGSIPTATATVEGKAVLGAQAAVPFASLGTCAAGNRGQTKQLTDLNKGTRTCTLTTGSTYAWVDDESGVYRPERFGVVTAASDSSVAINAAIDAAYAAGGGTVVLPSGTIGISSKIALKSYVKLIGQLRNTELTTLLGFSDTMMVDLIEIPTDYHRYSEISGIKFTSTLSTVAAVRNVGATISVVCRMNNIQINSVHGIILAKYVQEFLLENITAVGQVDQFIRISGNVNTLKGIFLEGTSTGTEPFVLLTNDTSGACNGNFIQNMVLEGVTSASKALFKTVGVIGLTLVDVWVEPTLIPTNAFVFDTSKKVKFLGSLVYSTQGKIQLVSSDVYLDQFSAPDTYNVLPSALIDVDSTSSLEIGRLYTRYGLGAHWWAATRNIIVRSNTYGASTVTATTAAQNLVSPGIAGDLVTNGDFEAGVFGWSAYGVAATYTSEASEIFTGQQMRISQSTGGAAGLSQAILAVTSDMIGKPVTITGWWRLEGAGTASVYPFGAGVSANGLEAYLTVAAGWERFSITAVPTSAATLSVAFATNSGDATSILRLDKISASIGKTPAPPLEGKTLTLGSGANTITYNSAAPSTGTWKAGDVVFNTAPTALGVAGWVCTTAGTSGTWTAFYTNNQATGTTSTPTFSTLTLSSTGTATATAGAATLNTQTGTITSEALTTASGSAYALTITNSKVTTSSIVTASVQNGTNSVDNYYVQRVTPGSGSVTIVIYNNSGSALNGTIKVSFIVM